MSNATTQLPGPGSVFKGFSANGPRDSLELILDFEDGSSTTTNVTVDQLSRLRLWDCMPIHEIVVLKEHGERLVLVPDNLTTWATLEKRIEAARDSSG